jgi:hypothetical protein
MFFFGKILVKLSIQVSLVIRGRYVPPFWTANLEIADKKAVFN